ncbi:putative xanthine dehydrogenase subunit A [Baekduia alba]|uniref:XdhC family protein n=1 Tax=Baekduia alba TaxID=2997333 RepID=UPI00233F9447|nr:XdhC/CoxI family protein [Baekduia alba]WCB94106.1 putative xanthine dehydrogenase subunit A [Baekduia alba]
MRELLDALGRWEARGLQVATATVVDTQRSAPQPPGAKLALNADGDVAGAVSGGCVESAVVEVAADVLAGGPPRLLHYGIADAEAWDVGLPCGGELDIWVQRHDAAGHGGAFARRIRDGERVALVTAVDGQVPQPGATLLVGADAHADGTLGDPDLDAAALDLAAAALWTERRGLHDTPHGRVFVDAVAPPPRLLVFGAVDFAAQLAALATVAGWRVFVIDPRSRFATASRFPAAERVVAQWPQEAVPVLGGVDRATAVVVLTHDPKLDDAALGLALRSDAPYIGAMGSRRAQARRRERLRAAGFDDADLARLSAPVGLDLGAVTAEETAVSILAELIAVRHGRDGGRLKDARGRVHQAT